MAKQSMGMRIRDVVLVSAESFDNLQEAYPNYFVDIREFVTIMRDILE